MATEDKIETFIAQLRADAQLERDTHDGDDVYQSIQLDLAARIIEALVAPPSSYEVVVGRVKWDKTQSMGDVLDAFHAARLRSIEL